MNNGDLLVPAFHEHQAVVVRDQSSWFPAQDFCVQKLKTRLATKF